MQDQDRLQPFFSLTNKHFYFTAAYAFLTLIYLGLFFTDGFDWDKMIIAGLFFSIACSEVADHYQDQVNALNEEIIENLRSVA